MFIRRPLMYVAFSMIIGIALSYYLNWQPDYLTPISVLICIVALIFLFTSRRFFIFILIAAAFFGGAALFANGYRSELEGLDLTKEYKITGRVSDIRTSNYNILTLDKVNIEDEEGNFYSLPKKTQVYTSETLSYGDIIHYNAVITPPSSPRNPGAFDNKMYLAANDIGFSSFVYELNVIGNDDQWYFFPYKLRDYIAGEIDYYFTEQTAAVAKAMLIGLKEDIPDEVKNEFSQTGISHVLAISGLHITLLSGVLDWFLKKLSVIRGLRFSLNIGFLLFYSILTGLSASVIRASVIGICIIIGRWKFAKRDMLTFLSAALIISLLINSIRLFMPGFLMSFGVFFGLICITPQIDRLFTRLNFENSFSRSLSASIAASIAIFPLTAYFFGGISLIAPLANFFAVPLAMIIVFSSGIFLAFSAIPFIGSLFSVIPQLASSFLVYLNHAVASWDVGFIKTPDFPIYLCVLTYIAIFFVSDFILIKNRYKYIMAACCGAGIGILFYNYNLIINDYQIKSVILDVGTGDAIHLKTPRYDYLIDNGGNLQYSNLNEYTQNNDIIYDAVIISNDRSKNLESIITGGEARKLLVPNNYEMKDYDENTLMQNYNIDEEIPLDSDISLMPVVTDGKNISFVLKIENQPVCLFAQNAAEELYDIYNIDVLKLSKGGNADSINEEIIEKISPEEVIISVKANNSGDLPDKNILKLLNDYNIPFYSTSESGAVTITWKKDGERIVETMK